MTKLIIVCGLPCSGKSTAAGVIADSLGYENFDEGDPNHPADYQFHAFIKKEQLEAFSQSEISEIIGISEEKLGGYVCPLFDVNDNLRERLLGYKIYDALPWEIERPLMLEKWREFAEISGDRAGYVLNCVLLQNPMCETMLRFGFDISVSESYIKEIADIIGPFHRLSYILKPLTLI